MAVPSSGNELRMSGIFAELDENDYTAASQEECRLSQLSDGTVQTINLANVSANRPDGSAPHAMSEFYSYDHDSTTTYWGAYNGAVGIADFTFSVSSGTPGVSALKTITLSNGSGTTSVYLSSNVSGTKGAIDVEMSVSNSGDPGTGGTSNSASGFNNYISTGPYLFTSQNGSKTYYIRFRYASGGVGTTNATIYFTNNSVTDTTGMSVQIS